MRDDPWEHEEGWDNELDEYEEQLSNCGMMRGSDGQLEGCSLAGTEYCDFECHIDWSDDDDEED